MVVAFVSCETGIVDVSKAPSDWQNQVQARFTIILSEAFHRDMNPSYRGLYNPSGKHELVCITITGGSEPGQIIPECPHGCFGWRAKGERHKAVSGTKAYPKSSIYYIGLSPGKPSWNWVGEMGMDSKDSDPLSDAAATHAEWRMLLTNEFKPHFLKPSVIFIGIDGKPSTGEGKAVDVEVTEVINGALGRDSKYLITYHGTYHPSEDTRKWFYFRFIATDECTEADPCIGWVALGCDSLFDPKFFGHGYDQRYVGILKPNRGPGPTRFTVIWKYLGTRTLAEQEEWSKINDKFVKQWEFHHK
ncbi:hypothetical protein BDP27DRAFT_270432 [Rhodocollybia butyracea]|uniref:Uncharacterized protein n=1 Tax=Rhodocollybia butyracea TaxID=206335 RepID=A0A9P5Q448_9AGAR|nr:hypothetical protein BDP27DRAFT_270432 [Rhodocollybia butyracea]